MPYEAGYDQLDALRATCHWIVLVSRYAPACHGQIRTTAANWCVASG